VNFYIVIPAKAGIHNQEERKENLRNMEFKRRRQMAEGR
jgi:hypothetical protein